jgi:hypothetical protein
VRVEKRPTPQTQQRMFLEQLTHIRLSLTESGRIQAR